MKTLTFCMSLIVIVGLVLGAGCGGDSGSGGGSPATQPAYSQSDLAGTWYLSILQTWPTTSFMAGPSGWMRGSATIDASGSVTASSVFANTGMILPITGSILTIDPAAGTISWSVGTSRTVFHGRLASNKQLLVGTTTAYSGPYPPSASHLYVMQKRNPQTTYAAADITNKTFMMNQIESGDSTSKWMFARGSTDASAAISIPVFTYPTGTAPGGAIGTLMIDQVSGLVSMSANTWFQGMMSPDKSYIVGTETDVNDMTTHRLNVIQMRDPARTFSLADLAGTYDFYALTTHLGWGHGTQITGTAGNITITTFTSNWQASIGMYSTRIVSLDGLVSDQSNTSYHGVLSVQKDFIVSTRTQGTGPESSFNISVK